jgi:CheY-like chemotaxis protein
MVYGSVKQLDGYILVKDNEGPGTTFEIYLPRAMAEPESQRMPTDGKSPNVTETILLVEDELIVRELSRQLLESCGYRVVDAADGREAVELFKTFNGKIDLLLTDVVMPEMSGRELADQLKALQPDLKILFASGYIEDTNGGKGSTHKIVNFIQKPFTQENLSRKIRDILGSANTT